VPAPRKRPNWVAQAIAAVGGGTQAAMICRVRAATLYDWKKRGAIRLAKPCLLLAEASGIPAKRLAGLEE